MRIENNILIAECTAYDFKGELERKKLKDWLKSVSAFPNTEGGTIFFGVGNDASIVGIANPQKDMEFISEKINSHLDPIPVYSLKPVETADGKVILVLEFPVGQQTPYYLSLDGKRIAYVRRGNQSVPATSRELFELVLRGSNRSWDSLVSNELREKHTFNTLEKEYNLRSGSRWEESLLSSFGLITEDGHLTNAGLLFADRCPVTQSRVYCKNGTAPEKPTLSTTRNTMAICFTCSIWPRVSSRRTRPFAGTSSRTTGSTFLNMPKGPLRRCA